MVKRILIVVIGVIVLILGCGPTYRKEIRKILEKEEKYDGQKLDVAVDYSYRFFGVLVDDKWQINYSRVTKTEAVAMMDKLLEDIDAVLDYKDEYIAKYLKTFGLRLYFEQKEREFRVARAWLQTSKLYDAFGSLMGTRPWYYGQQDEFGYDRSLGYDPSILLVENPAEKYPFRSKTVDESKAAGILKPVTKFSLTYERELDHKVPDSNYPNDSNRFSWRSKRYALEAVGYKVLVPGDNPESNYGNYLEAYRLSDKGQKESYPALLAFLDERGTAVVIIDVDKETEVGHGLPDFVEFGILENSLLSDVMVGRLFPEKKEYERIEPKKPPVHIEIVQAGQKIEEWELSADPKGWTVPLSYQYYPPKNYNVRISFKKDEKKEEHDSDLRKIEYFVKEWTGGERYKSSFGRVIEYFKTKSPYNDQIKSAVVLHEEDTQKIKVILGGGEEKVGFVSPGKNAFIEDKPEAIAYTIGETRWLIKDDNNDEIYEKRKKVSEPAERTGVYENQ